MAIDVKLIDKLLADYQKPEDIIGENGLLKQLTKALLERAMQAEMTDHLGYEKHDPAGNNSGNSRNGATTKTLKGDFGEMPLATPRDRNGSYEPKIIAKGQTRFTGFDDKIISMYARGMSTREIQGHLEEIYKVEVSPMLISSVTEEVMEEVKSWQSRPLDAVYPIVYLDALVVKIREAGHVRNRAVYVAIGVNMQGSKEVLGLWTGQAEGSKFWLQVLTELKNRGRLIPRARDRFASAKTAFQRRKQHSRCVRSARRWAAGWLLHQEHSARRVRRHVFWHRPDLWRLGTG
jgi:putative transposase